MIQAAAALNSANNPKKVKRIAADGDVMAALPGWSTRGVLLTE